MIRTGKLKTTPSEYIRKRVVKMQASLLQCIEDFENIVDVRVEPYDSDKPVRIVRFINEANKEVQILCFEEGNLANCPANKFATPCSHVYAAVDKLLEIHDESKEQPNEPEHPNK